MQIQSRHSPSMILAQMILLRAPNRRHIITKAQQGLAKTVRDAADAVVVADVEGVAERPMIHLTALRR